MVDVVSESALKKWFRFKSKGFKSKDRDNRKCLARTLENYLFMARGVDPGGDDLDPDPTVNLSYDGGFTDLRYDEGGVKVPPPHFYLCKQ